tara:strand:- start:1324 stop:1854 length:531 start_codon:yes stop_codon:yes gene_type:complete
VFRVEVPLKKKSLEENAMAAVSLSEAWNDTALMDETPPPSPPPKPKAMTAARRSAPKKADPPVDDETDADIEVVAPLKVSSTTVIEAPPHPAPHPAPQPAPQMSYQELLLQLELLRKEESRRCTIYIAIGGILFALLFVYIDRLNQQVRMLNTFLLHRHMPTLAAVSGPGPFHTLS